MASDNLMTMDQSSMYRPTFGDACFSDFIFNKETETLTKALTKSFATTTNSNSNFNLFSAELVAQPEITPVQTPSASAGSENEVQISKRSWNLPPSGRVTKRKSRASKRATTTFITADPANFRQMVQQVTGVGQIQAAPEPQRVISRFGGGGFPTLDTSSFFVDGSGAGYMAQIPAPAMVVGDGGVGSELDGFCSFPTLESSKVMLL